MAKYIALWEKENGAPCFHLEPIEVGDYQVLRVVGLYARHYSSKKNGHGVAGWLSFGITSPYGRPL